MKKATIAAAILGLTGCTNQSIQTTTQEATQSRYIFMASEEHNQLAQSIVKQHLKDPESAQFRNTFITTPSSDTTKLSYCGEVNAKNIYGGYTGFKPFFVDFQSGPIFWDKQNPGSIDNDLIKMICFDNVVQPPTP